MLTVMRPSFMNESICFSIFEYIPCCTNYTNLTNSNASIYYLSQNPYITDLAVYRYYFDTSRYNIVHTHLQ